MHTCPEQVGKTSFYAFETAESGCKYKTRAIAQASYHKLLFSLVKSETQANA